MLFVTAVGVFGLLIGSFLNVVIWRVPRAESILPASRCPSCGGAIRPWQNVPVVSWVLLRGRCAQCRTRISVRYPLIELGTAVLFAAVAYWRLSVTDPLAYWGDFGVAAGISVWASLAGFLWFSGAAVALTAIDLELKRLPDAIVLPSLAVVVCTLSLSCTVVGDWSGLIRTFAGAAVMFACYFVIVWVYPSGMGGGDVKLSPLIGAVLGYVGWGAVAVGGFFAFVLGALVGVILIVLKRVERKKGVPFGPFMLLGAFLGLVIGEPVMEWYLGIAGIY